MDDLKIERRTDDKDFPRPENPTELGGDINTDLSPLCRCEKPKLRSFIKQGEKPRAFLIDGKVVKADYKAYTCSECENTIYIPTKYYSWGINNP